MRRGAVALLLLGLCAAGAAATPSSEVQAGNVRVFDSAWSIVERRYWDRTMHGLDWAAERDRFLTRARDAADGRALYVVINALLDRLGDSHVYATSPERRSFARAGGNESGFGFDAFWSSGAWWIRTVQAGGPAALTGMKVGWRLLSVDGKPVDIDDHFGEGDVAALVLLDEDGGRHAMTLRGAPLPPQSSRRPRRIGDDVLLLAFDQFASGEDRWLAREITAAAPRAVILDMRENEGGEAGVLDRVAGLFVAERQVVLRLIGRRRTHDEETGGTPVWHGPLAILVGPRTASAAEALAAFLDETRRAESIGERTAGALTAGVEHRLPDGGRLTVAEDDIRTPAGVRLEGVGFMPRHRVVPTLAQRRAGQDPALDAALALLAGRRQAGGVSTSMSPPSER